MVSEELGGDTLRKGLARVLRIQVQEAGKGNDYLEKGKRDWVKITSGRARARGRKADLKGLCVLCSKTLPGHREEDEGTPKRIRI